ncbi:A-kinase anchor protein SPHKAP isoform X3 [Tyto alba]|uniref:A-kinase anchor protein SPHKAP isoform X3 n=1 Tax=Tyto alba TaxID=56313 RepID=UPI001C66EAD6|nr:A-kinase anchor protein SPHKAP isoform X3 [Tyto alba]XP_032861297.2 A-kinase anchor protein SPHKAP isoform X3 [Tyto alba]XP_042652115.1 A-kinase anchor protein SPHKAP isoform X3 [Tyto alba]
MKSQSSKAAAQTVWQAVWEALSQHILCSNSLLESTDYWLQNQRTPCQIGFLEDKSENNCASVCFVNLDANRDDCSDEQVKQRLISVSPNLPKLISSMNVQPPKENEIVLLSGLASGKLQADYEVPQCPWLADVCLVQCARGDRRASASCIIFDINKFLIGLELVQERQLQIDTHVLKPEDDTNCSVSSIEEDFLTASEHLEDDNEADEYKTGHEKLSVSEVSSDVKKNKGKGFENLHYRKARLPSILEGNCINKDNTSTRVSEAVNVVAKDVVLQPEDKSVQEILWQKELAERATSSFSTTDLTSEVENSCSVHMLDDVSLTKMAKEELGPPCDLIAKHDSKTDGEDCAGIRKTDPPSQNEQATTGQYATNLAESVLQDAFIRLSQSQPTFSEEAAVSISVGSSCKSEDVSASRSWNELPKIVIVQSPDSSENTSDWPGPAFPSLCHWTESESSAEVSDYVEEEHSNGPGQSALEVALACAATVIGTISSPQAAEKFRWDQEATDSKSRAGGNKEIHAASSQLLDDCAGTEYSFPSALCGMTQVASAVAVCGLGEMKEEKYPATSSGLLSAAQTSAAITLHCSIAIGSSMEKLNDSIAEALLKEASIILTKPNTYKNVGHFIESINGKIIETAARPRIPHTDEVIRDELAQNLSNIILRHSVEEVRKKRQLHPCSENGSSTQDIFMETANELLFNIIYFTCKKMNDIRQVEECSLFSKGTKSEKVTRAEGWSTQATARESSHSSLEHSAVNPFGTSYSTSASKDPGNVTNTRKSNMKDVHNKGSATLNSEPTSRATGHNALVAKTSPKKRYLKRTARDCYKSPNQSNSHQKKKDYRSFSDRENTFANNECRHGVQEQLSSSATMSAENQAKHKCDAVLNNDVQVSLSLLGNHVLLPSQPVLQVKHSRDKYCITDFAEELAETVVSMATEIAAICLENSNGKQPWFCAWKRGNEHLVTQSLSCRTMKRKKETHANGSVVRKHRAPRLSEIKRKTDEHPELKERLMNRVVDESINLEDTPDSVNIFANEVAAKIMNLTEFSMVDSIWQGPNHPRNRLHCERWSRAKASSCESIPEEESDSKASFNTLGLMNTFGQSVSQTSSVSKQSSCESITDEFSRFMVNQMENEGRGFDLLLDYYAGKNANNILTSALQQVAKKNGHLNVRPSCPSKQSSTESITEEFYRYMLREIEKENKDNVSSPWNSKDWCGSLLPPSLRSPFCFRQSSVPDSRSSGSRLTVNVPVKANSLDGFAHHHQDSLSVQPVSTVASSGLCKSDSCLYQRCKTDQITDMLIHETWASSIESLMRKNKIIADGAEADQFHSDSPPHVEQYANRLAANIVESGKNFIIVQQDSFDYTSREHVLESKHPQSPNQIQSKPKMDGVSLDDKKEHMKSPGCLPAGQHREVPLIQIETDQRDEPDKDSECLSSYGRSGKEHQNKEKPPEAFDGKHRVSSSLLNSLVDFNEQHCLKIGGTSLFAYITISMCLPCHPTSNSPQSRSDAEIVGETKTAEEFPNHLSSSEESTGSWSQLANDEDNPDDTSSYLQLSERSLSNGNSSTTSSLGIMDLEIYQENMPSSPMINELVEEKVFLKEQTENTEESTSALSVGTANCQKDLLVINFDLEPECPNAELRATLQWIAASELGIPTIYFKKSQENRIEKFLDVVQLVQRKSWKVGDIFHAVVQYCKLSEEDREMKPSLFDWLLELG